MASAVPSSFAPLAASKRPAVLHPSRLVLWFAGRDAPELIRTSFTSDLGDERRVCVRGKTSGACPGCTTFQWTPAVRALALLFIRAKIFESRNAFGHEQAGLAGGRGSAACSLDYALSKAPAWLVEMFGWDKAGNPLALKLIKRSNSCLKRAGDVILSLNGSCWERGGIEIFVDDKPLSNAEDFARLEHFVQRDGSWGREKRKKPLTDFQFSMPAGNPVEKVCEQERKNGRDRLRKILLDEVRARLSAPEFFTRQGLRNAVRNLLSDPSFLSVAGAKSERAAVLAEQDNQVRLGIAEDEAGLRTTINARAPIRVIIPPPLVPSMAVMTYLQQVKRYDIDIDYRYPHAVEVAKAVLAGSFKEAPHLLALGCAPAATLLARGKKCEYEPFMLMPRVSHRIVVPKEAKRSTGSRVRFGYLKADPSTASFVFDELARRKEIDEKKAALAHLEPDEAFLELVAGEPDFRALLFFPYDRIAMEFGGCSFVEHPEPRVLEKEVVLFAHRSLLSDRKFAVSLELAVKNAWLELVERPELAARTVDDLAADDQYMKFLRRCSGLSCSGLSAGI